MYYIERSYRVSDYGLWERGTKYNNGEPELHARYPSNLSITISILFHCDSFYQSVLCSCVSFQLFGYGEIGPGSNQRIQRFWRKSTYPILHIFSILNYNAIVSFLFFVFLNEISFSSGIFFVPSFCQELYNFNSVTS